MTTTGPARPQSHQALFETSDVADAERILSRAYGTVRIDDHGRGGSMRLAQDSLSSSARLDHVRFSMCFDATGAPPDALPIGHLRSGMLRNVSDGSERSHRPGDVFLAVQHPYTARVENMDLEVAVLDPVLVGHIADSAPTRSQQPIRFTGYEPVSRRAADTWKSTYDYVSQLARTQPGALSQRLTADSAARLLAAVALAAFPNNALLDPTIEDRRDAHPATLRRAITFVDEHAHEGISLADIAAAAHVTIRAVQLAFRRHLDTTPSEYLRRVRLDHAHRDLLAADPAHDSVTAVAYRWGFASSSRFAAYYRQAYGLPPGRTLHD